jgi:septal ring factor EnvC (AmiA/AmiB activator)
MENVYAKLKTIQEEMENTRFLLEKSEAENLSLRQQLNAAEEEIRSLTVCNRTLQDRALKNEPIG